MYHFLQDLAIQQHLQDKFSVKISQQTFNNEDNYLLIELPRKEDVLIVKGKEMVVVNQHFTVPEKKDIKSNSTYHYTLVLKDNDKHYKTHLYFDDFDRIRLEPKLFSKDDKFITIDDKGMNDIYAFSTLSTTIVSFIRKAQKEAFMLLTEQIKSKEIELATLNENIESLENQIALLTTLESIGYPLLKNERKFYERLLQILNQPIIKSEEPLEKSKHFQRGDMPPKACVPKNRSVASPYKRQEKKSSKNKQSNPKSGGNLIAASKQCIQRFDQSESENFQQKLIQDMIDKVVQLRSFNLFSKDTNDSLLAISAQLKARISAYFDNVDLILNHQLYILAVRANIVPLKDAFIIQVIELDNQDIIKNVLTLNLFTAATKITLSDPDHNFTLVEWCVYFDAVKCFGLLMNNQFSFDYVSEDNSPLTLLSDDPQKAFKFLDLKVLNFKVLEKLQQRLLRMLTEKAKFATGDQLKLIELKLEQFKYSNKLFKFLKIDPKYKFIMTSNLNRSKLNPDLLRALQNHIGAQEVALRMNIATEEAFRSIPLPVLLANKRQAGQNVEKEAQEGLEELNAMTIDDAITTIIASQNKILANYNFVMSLFNNQFSFLSQNRGQRHVQNRGRCQNTNQPLQEILIQASFNDVCDNIGQQPQITHNDNASILNAFRNLNVNETVPENPPAPINNTHEYHYRQK